MGKELARRRVSPAQRRRENPGRPEGIVRLVLEAIRDVAYAGAGNERDGEQAADSLIDEACENIRDLWAWQRALAGLRTGSWLLKGAIERAMIRDLKDEAMRLDESLVRVDVEPPLRRIKDLDGLIAYLELSHGALLCFSPTDLKTAGLRAYAASRGENPDEIVDRFLEWVGPEGPPILKIHRMEYAPYWGLHLKEGERMKQPPRTGGYE